MKPFRFAYFVFNPQFLVVAFKETRKLKGKPDYFVVVVSTVGTPQSIRAIDANEQQGILQDFHNAWYAATLG